MSSGTSSLTKARIRDLRLQASDLDWSTGSGQQIQGSAEALLMAMVGRRGASGSDGRWRRRPRRSDVTRAVGHGRSPPS